MLVRRLFAHPCSWLRYLGIQGGVYLYMYGYNACLLVRLLSHAKRFESEA